MRRYKITLEYDGTPFVGWQRQEKGPSIQAAVEAAITGFSGETVNLFGAGRTDAGVHALGQVAHFDLEKDCEADTVRDALNYHLKPNPIAVIAAEETDTEFHARFDATKRHYMYRLTNRRAPLTLDANRAWLVHPPLDADRMHEAAQFLVGRHDFSTFRSSQCQAKSPVKTLDAISVRRVGEEIEVTAQARSFLHHQVRSIVGTLERVGVGKWRPKDVANALKSKDRAACGPMAPACGLYLVRVDYDATTPSECARST